MSAIERIKQPVRMEAPHKGRAIGARPPGARVSTGVDLFIAEGEKTLREVEWNLDAFISPSNGRPIRIIGNRWRSYRIMCGIEESGNHLVATFLSDDYNLNNEPLSTRFNLTERQREMLSLVAQGLNDKKIAETLAISPTTVTKHTKVIRQMLGQDTRVAAVVVAARNNLFDSKPEELREVPIEVFDQLPNSERHILDLMIGAGGNQPVTTDKEIARKRGVILQTIKNLFASMSKKTNSRNRIQLVLSYFYYTTQRDQILQLRQPQ